MLVISVRVKKNQTGLALINMLLWKNDNSS